MQKKMDKKPKGLLTLLESQRQKISLSSLSKSNNPAGILKLIAKCEELITHLDESDADVVSELLLTVTKLKILLSYLFKKKRQKLLELHWEKLEEEAEHRRNRLQEGVF